MRKLISTRTTGIYRFIRAFNTNLLQSLMPKQNLLLRLNIYDTSNISSKRWFFVSPNFIDYREFLTPIRIPNTMNETNDRVDRPKFAKICREIYRIFVVSRSLISVYIALFINFIALNLFRATLKKKMALIFLRSPS